MSKIKFSSWPDFEQYLEKLGLFRMQPGIERIEEVLTKSDLKRPPFFLVQGVGTNAKGSCCTFLASLSQSHGLLCGLNTSPHFLSVRERVRLFKPAPASNQGQGERYPEKDWLKAANAVMARGGENLTYFELVTVISLFMFSEAKVDIAIMESGLGGKFDATTALDADLVFFTPIALDHCDILGFTLREIACDKAGAIREKTPAISARQHQEVKKELEKASKKLEAPLSFCPGPDILPPGLPPLTLHGQHQLDNSALSLFTWRAMRPLLAKLPKLVNKINADPKAEIRGLAQACIPGRMQFIAANKGIELPMPHPPIILDGGHNAQALSTLGHSLAFLNIAPPVTIFACLRDKQPERLAPHLRVLAAGLILIPQMPDNPRAMPAEELAQLIGSSAKAVSNMAEAIRIANAEFAERLPEALNMDMLDCKYPLLICGSLYLLAEFYRLYPQYLASQEKK